MTNSALSEMVNPTDVSKHCSIFCQNNGCLQNFLASVVVKAPKSCHISAVLKSLQWLKINERIDYKLLSLTYKVLTATQLSYLHYLISLQPPHCTRTSSVVTLACPLASSSLKITSCSLWLPAVAQAIAKTIIFCRCFKILLLEDLLTLFSRHFRNFTTWHGSSFNRTFAIGLLHGSPLEQMRGTNPKFLRFSEQTLICLAPPFLRKIKNLKQ